LVSDEILAKGDKAMSQFVQVGAMSGILVDRGDGFGIEHTTFWNRDRWCDVSADEEGLSQVIDRYTMRQKVMLQLQIGRTPFKRFVEMNLINYTAMQLS
jgi:hypothetical protein